MGTVFTEELVVKYQTSSKDFLFSFLQKMKNHKMLICYVDCGLCRVFLELVAFCENPSAGSKFQL